MGPLGENTEFGDRLPEQLIEWRLRHLEEGQELLSEAMARVELKLGTAGAVMKFAMGLASVVGAVVAFVLDYFVRK